MVTLLSGKEKVDGRTAWIIGIAVTGETGGVNVNDASATSLLLLGWRPATVVMHLVELFLSAITSSPLGHQVLDIVVMKSGSSLEMTENLQNGLWKISLGEGESLTAWLR